MSEPALRLQLRTPFGLLVDRPIRGLRAEDESGWFGIRPGREDLIAILPPGLLVFEDERGETFVALSGGLLNLQNGLCRVMAREAELSSKLSDVAARLEHALLLRRERAARQRDALADLEREALRRLVREGRT